jgi:hypothetical protein
MSACNIIVRPDVAYLFADGAAYDQDGRVTSISGKIQPLASISAAMITTGRVLDSIFYAGALDGRADDFDDLIENVSNWLPEIVLECLSNFGVDDHGLGQRLVFAGWSKKRNACYGFGIATMDDISGHKAFEVIRVDTAMQSPALTEAEFLTGFGHAPTMADVADIETMALTVVELQRQQKQEWADGQHIVGGILELVTVQRDRIESRVLKRWPDRPGEFIKPEPVDWPAWRAARSKPVSDFSGLSRMQRERMQKKLKKGTLRAL